jgi:hypothetical protein
LKKYQTDKKNKETDKFFYEAGVDEKNAFAPLKKNEVEKKYE